MHPKSITIQIDLDRTAFRLLLIALICLTLGGSVAYAGESLAPSQTVSTACVGRQYYLTSSSYTGDLADDACAAGYHMAALWEILDTSNLAYNTTLGYVHLAGDGGPPTNIWGWARTGGVPSILSNCATWSMANDWSSGSIIALPDNWSTPGSTMGVWKTSYSGCDIPQPVWCVED